MRCAPHKVGKERGGDVNLQQLWLLSHTMCHRPCVHICCRDWEGSELCLLGLIEMPDGEGSLARHKASTIVSQQH